MFFVKALGLGDVPSIINNGMRTITAWLCQVIYPWIAKFYQLFKELGMVAFSEDFSQIYNKISLIIGIFMVFRISFWLIELLVNPDQIADKEKNPGKIIQKVLICVVLLATTPTIFKWANNLQNIILEENIIETIINGNGETIDPEYTGKSISANLFINFYTANKNENGAVGKCAEFAGENGIHYSNLFNDGKLSHLTNKCLTEKFPDDNEDDEYDSEYQIDFNGLFAVGVGGVVFWMILMYCISVGARYVQLIYLQIIAPIPIMCYLAPGKDNMFSKWVKQCTTTYLDLFIRIGIINFVMYLAEVILSNDNNFVLNMGNSDLNWEIKVFLVLGLLIFAKKAPELIQELLPKSVTKASGDFGLSWKKRTDSMLFGKQIYGATTTAARAASYGVAGGALTGAIGFLGGRGLGGKLTGAFGGMARGIASGAKSGSPIKNFNAGVKKQNEVNKRNIDWKNNGSSLPGRMHQRAANAFGFAGPAETYENRISKYDKELTKLNSKASAYSEVSGSVGKMEERATSQLDNKTFKPTQTYQRELQERRRNYRALHQAMSNGDETTALSLARSELNRVNNQIAVLVAAGKGPGDTEYDNLSAQWNRIEGIVNSIRTKDYNASKAEADMTDVLTETRNEFITKSLQDADGDSAIKNEAKHIQDVVNHEDNKEAFADFNSNANGSTYEEFDKFSGDAKAANTELSREIYETKTAKDALANSEEKKRADADRNAVGGHKGGK